VISTLLAENPTLVRILFVVVVASSTVIGWLLHQSRRSSALLILATISLVGTLALTLSPSSGFATAFCTVQFSVPFQGIDTLANVAMMLPLTLFAALRLGRPLPVFAAVSCLSALIELLQALVPTLGRACDTNDWFMNTIGAALGAVLAVVISTVVEAHRSGRLHRTSP
jgi:glycopeptide antibiotics resistance protein